MQPNTYGVRTQVRSDQNSMGHPDTSAILGGSLSNASAPDPKGPVRVMLRRELIVKRPAEPVIHD